MATLYVGGRLFDGEKVLDGHAVLEEDGKVKRVAPAGEFAGFAGTRVDTAGGTLIPGMIDCHVHSLSGAEGNPGSRGPRGVTGRLISAKGDPWETMGTWGAELAGTDIYTLRRIVPEERGKKF